MRAEDSVMWKGRRYVTRSQFAKELCISPDYVRKLVYNGTLTDISLNKSAARYIDIEAGKMAIAMLPDKGGRKAKTGKKRNGESPYGKVDSEAKVASVSGPGIAMPEVEPMASPDGIVDLDSLDKGKYADCLIPDTNMYDYDRLKARLTAETYEYKLEKEKGQHVPKTDIILAAKAIAQIIRTNLDAVPARYASAFIALAETYSKHEFTEDEKLELRNRLKGVGPQIMLSIQSEIRKLLDE